MPNQDLSGLGVKKKKKNRKIQWYEEPDEHTRGRSGRCQTKPVSRRKHNITCFLLLPFLLFFGRFYDRGEYTCISFHAVVLEGYTQLSSIENTNAVFVGSGDVDLTLDSTSGTQFSAISITIPQLISPPSTPRPHSCQAIYLFPECSVFKKLRAFRARLFLLVSLFRTGKRIRVTGGVPSKYWRRSSPDEATCSLISKPRYWPLIVK